MTPNSTPPPRESHILDYIRGKWARSTAFFVAEAAQVGITLSKQCGACSLPEAVTSFSSPRVSRRAPLHPMHPSTV